MRIHQEDRTPRPRTRPRRRWPLGDRSGQVVAFFAVTSIPLLAIMALAVDWGLLLTARDEAQRAADSGALAGAAMFKGCTNLTCATRVQPAQDTAVHYATLNFIRQTKIDPSEVTVQVDVNERLVRVFVDRAGVPTFFAHFLGIPVAPIGAVAAAKVSTGGTGQCVMPFFGVDMYREGDPTENGNQIPEPGENWVWGDQSPIDLSPTTSNPNPPSAPGACPPGSDCYQPFQLSTGSGTGFGSPMRDGLGPVPYSDDYGRPVVIEAGPPNGQQGPLGQMWAPGNFQLWKVPLPVEVQPGVWDCTNPDTSYGTNGIVALLSGNIPCSCPVSLSDPQDVKPGGAWNPVANAIETRINADPTNTTWDATTQDLVCNLGFGPDCYGSSAVVSIALGNPNQVVDLSGASSPIYFNNLARMLLESVVNPHGPGGKVVNARFLGFVPGGGGPTSGQLVEYLRLVE